MPIGDKMTETPANGWTEVEELHKRVRALEDECNRLKQALAVSEAERKRYRQAFLDQARAAREFVDVDVDSLDAKSAGPVELLG